MQSQKKNLLNYYSQFYLSPLPAIVTPPSIVITCPVIKEPALEASNIAAPVTSSTVPILPKGACSSTSFNISGFSHNSLAKSVFIMPGHKPFTLILNFPSSTASFLLALYQQF